MQHIPYIPKYTSNQSFKNDFTQSFSLAFIIRKNALILYSFSEEKEVQNGLFYHFIYKTLVVNWSNMLHRKVSILNIIHLGICKIISEISPFTHISSFMVLQQEEKYLFTNVYHKFISNYVNNCKPHLTKWGGYHLNICNIFHI